MSSLDVQQQHRISIRNDDGQTMAEYGVVLTVITVGVVLTFGLLSGVIVATIDRVIQIIP